MKKILGQSGLTKKITTTIAKNNRSKFRKLIDNDLVLMIKDINCQKKIEMEVVSFSSNSDYDEQLLSILSFLRYVGKPISWTIYSDGSHTAKQKEQISTDTDFVVIKSIDWESITSLEGICCDDLKPYHIYILHYASAHAFGKRLF
jgi:hypothetical protein